jgi:putative transposase
VTVRRSLVSSEERPSIRRQCELLTVNRSMLYYEPAEVGPEELQLMRLMDELYLARPNFGKRSMVWALEEKGHIVNVKRVRRLRQLMGLVSLAPKPNTSRSHPAHKKYPYLLRNLDVVRGNQVWATDITYIPLAKGFCYLAAVVDWFSRAVLAWRLSNTLETTFCVAALEEALANFGTPGIFNTDQGVHFTSTAFTDVLKAHDIRISMDGKGRCLDNVMVERLWRSLKYEDVHLRAYQNAWAARTGIGQYFRFFNHERRHQSLGYRTPMKVYLESMAAQRQLAA